MIQFPHLHITLSGVGNHITVFGFKIAFYGMIIGLGILAGILFACFTAKITGQKIDNYIDLALYGIIVSILGARAYYVIFSWSYYSKHPKEILDIRGGGLAIYGGVLTAILFVIIYSKLKKVSTLMLMDSVAVGLVVGQAIGRWGNFFNREAFGEYTNGLFAMRLPINDVRFSDVTPLMDKHVQVIKGVSYIQVTPTFLFESIGCLCIFLFLIFYFKHKKFNGEIFFYYIGLYGVLRFFIERLRTDQLRIGNTKIAVSEVVAVCLVIVAIIGLALNYRDVLKGKVNKSNIKE